MAWNPIAAGLPTHFTLSMCKSKQTFFDMVYELGQKDLGVPYFQIKQISHFSGCSILRRNVQIQHASFLSLARTPLEEVNQMKIPSRKGKNDFYERNMLPAKGVRKGQKGIGL